MLTISYYWTIRHVGQENQKILPYGNWEIEELGPYQ